MLVAAGFRAWILVTLVRVTVTGGERARSSSAAVQMHGTDHSMVHVGRPAAAGPACCNGLQRSNVIARIHEQVSDSCSGAQLPLDKQRSIAGELDRTPGECVKKLEEFRNKLL